LRGNFAQKFFSAESVQFIARPGFVADPSRLRCRVNVRFWPKAACRFAEFTVI
jgi:hypothetical protein